MTNGMAMAMAMACNNVAADVAHGNKKAHFYVGY